MGVAAYAVLFFSIIGCIAYGFINWSKESTVPPVHKEEEEDKQAAV
ncbi:MAG: hypothetical protein PQJ61_12485 [Spirochaetales bacterium]|uniref:Uncharacterized protein n=1 Tax=Candidatus Thalassospirochaeta sargassi TaxID=3119039 RepID=A0AAJ1IG65_9SPIO|nr:hypothetical protein [Spirochaetales bacterium]